MNRFEHSVVSYPDRGQGGSSKWRGNSGPGIVKQFLLTWHTDHTGKLDTKGLVVDPMKGSNTTGDVAQELGLRYRGFDLYEGFDAARQDLLTALNGEKAKSVFLHPPYLGMIRYDEQWRRPANAADLSQVGTDEYAFDEMLQAIVQNVARATAPGGHYALLVGNWRQKGRYYHMASHVIALAPDDLQMEIIKVQNNVVSNGRSYSGSFVPTLHETMLVFRRAEDDSIFAMSGLTLQRLERLQKMTWRNIVASAMRSGEATTAQELFERLEAHPRAKTVTSTSLYAKVRQELRAHPETFARLSRGRYALTAA